MTIPRGPQGEVFLNFLTELNKSLTRIMANKNAHVLLGGDFNCGDVEWSTMQVPEGVPQRPVQIQLLEIIKDHCLSQVVKIPTRNDRTFFIYKFPIPGQSSEGDAPDRQGGS